MIRIVDTAFDPGAELAAFTAGCSDAVGGIASFTGLVRAGPERIRALTLEHYPGMTEAKLAAIEAAARERWSLSATIITHRVGRMIPGEAVVFVAAAAPHRAAALEACAYLIDWLKTEAPFWKLEETPSGERWVAALESDAEAAARWG
jgi:molybdopterin synthase catalytic subunit